MLPAAKYPANAWGGNEQTQPLLPEGGTDVANASDYNESAAEVKAHGDDLRAANIAGGKANHTAVHTDIEARLAADGGGAQIASLFGVGSDFLTTVFTFGKIFSDPSGLDIPDATPSASGILSSSIVLETAPVLTDPNNILTSAVFADATLQVSAHKTFTVRALVLTYSGGGAPGDFATIDWAWNDVPVQVTAEKFA